MKKTLLVAAAFAAYFGASAQSPNFTTGNTNFPTDATGVEQFSFVDSTTFWITSFDGSGGGATFQDIARTEDGGTSFISYPVTPAATAGLGIGSIFAKSADEAWVTAYNATSGGGQVFQTIDGGATWVQQMSSTFAAPAGFPNVLQFLDTNNGWAMGDPNGGKFEIYTTQDAGANWTRTPLANVPANLSGEFGIVSVASIVNANNIFFATNKARIYTSADKGLNWTVAGTITGANGANNLPTSLDFKDLNEGICVYAIGTTAQNLYKTNNGGAAWTQVNLSTQGVLIDARFVPGTDATVMATFNDAAGNGRYYAYSNDWGVTFDTIEAFTDFQTDGVNFLPFNKNNIWLGGFSSAANGTGIYKLVAPLVFPVGTQNVQNWIGDVNVYPNPTADYVTVKLNGDAQHKVEIALTDISGRVIWSDESNNNGSFLLKNIDMTSLAAGTYFVTIRNGFNYSVKEVVKK